MITRKQVDKYVKELYGLTNEELEDIILDHEACATLNDIIDFLQKFNLLEEDVTTK